MAPERFAYKLQAFPTSGDAMKTLPFKLAMLVVAGVRCATAQAQRAAHEPLTIAARAASSSAARTRTLGPAPGLAAAGGGESPSTRCTCSIRSRLRGDRHVPVVMVHGCCLSSKTWETTPDGRMGWDEYFVREDGRVSRGPSVARALGLRSSVDRAVKAGTVPPSALPNIINASHQIAWTVFRFGPSYGKPFPDGQFPIEAVEELYKQMIPDLNALLPTPNPDVDEHGGAGVRLNGAVLMGHSESGSSRAGGAHRSVGHPRHDLDRAAVPADLTAAQIATLAKIPTLDHVRRSPGRRAGRAGELGGVARRAASARREDEGRGRRRRDDAPAEDGHQGQQPHADAGPNNLQLADLILAWIDKRTVRALERELTVFPRH